MLAAQWGSLTNLARKLGITPGYASQLSSGHRPITEKTARWIEAELGLSVGWMDSRRHRNARAAAVDAEVMAASFALLDSLREEMGLTLSRERFGALLKMVYAHALVTGRIEEPYVRNLLELIK